MQLTIKLLPPYRQAGDKGELPLELQQRELTVQQLSEYLHQKWGDKLAYPLFDTIKGYHTAEYIVNGKHASLEQVLKNGDEVTVVPYISGG